MSTAAFIYARLDSSRLPGKALKLLGDRPMIDIVIDRAQKVKLDTCVLLTTSRPVDDPLVAHVEARGVKVVRGNTNDLVARTLQGIEAVCPTRFFRVNGDSPLFDSSLMEAAMMKMGNTKKLVSNLFQRTFPYGVAVELIDANCYSEYANEALADEKEHVTKHLYRVVNRSAQLTMMQKRDDSYLRLSVDTLEDHQKLDALLKKESWDKSYWDFYDLEKPSLVFE